MHIHFIGICGTFMGGLALIARQLGHTVSGSDRAFYPPMSEQLEAMDIGVYQGFESSVWEEITPDLVIVGNVCQRGMPIIEAMLDKGFNYTSGPRWLGETVLADRYVFAIAGTHGKTTTTAMLVHILRQRGIETGYLVGGVVPGLSGSADVGNSEFFVIEADEYDTAYFDKRPKFIHYHPDTFVIGNIEFDHADIYDSIEQIEQQFHYGVRLVPPAGSVIFGHGEHVDNVSAKGCWSHRIELDNAGYQWRDKVVSVDDKVVAILPPQLIGEHNQTNAMMACLAAQQAGLTIAEAAKCLANFSGVKRRLELLAEINDIRIFDDFAHHPTAIRLTLTAMQQSNPERRLISVFEPRSNTMKRGVHAAVLGEVLNIADASYVYLPTTLNWQLSGLHQVFSDTDALCQQLLHDLQAGDDVVMMSNGSFNGLHQQLISALGGDDE